MKIIFAARKDSYGGSFANEFDSLQELKEAIVSNATRRWDDDSNSLICDDYTEELFKTCAKEGRYSLCKIELANDEKLHWDEYDGQSWFKIVKKITPPVLSKIIWLEEETE